MGVGARCREGCLQRTQPGRPEGRRNRAHGRHSTAAVPEVTHTLCACYLCGSCTRSAMSRHHQALTPNTSLCSAQTLCCAKPCCVCLASPGSGFEWHPCPVCNAALTAEPMRCRLQLLVVTVDGRRLYMSVYPPTFGPPPPGQRPSQLQGEVARRAMPQPGAAPQGRVGLQPQPAARCAPVVPLHSFAGPGAPRAFPHSGQAHGCTPGRC